MPQTNDWMPRTLAGLQAMFSNVEGKIAGYQAALSLSLIQVGEIQSICNQFIAIYEFVGEAQATVHGLTEWRSLALTGSPKGAPLPAPGPFPSITLTGNEFIGILDMFRDWRARIVSNPGYTQAMGEDLMIVKVDGESLVPSEVTPRIQASAAQLGYLIGIMVADRGDSDMWLVESRQKGQDWKVAGSFTGKSGDITITPLSPGDPEQVELRVLLRRKNQPYGNPSQIATVTVNP